MLAPIGERAQARPRWYCPHCGQATLTFSGNYAGCRNRRCGVPPRLGARFATWQGRITDALEEGFENPYWDYE